MRFVVGLGNPGEKYEASRHNAGFMVLDLLAKQLDVSFSSQPKFQGLIAKKGDVMLVKPQTFMNESGKCVRSVLGFYAKELLGTSSIQELILIHDDLDLKVGSEKFVFDSGPKAHNGVNSVRESLGTEAFWYARLGVDGRVPERPIEPQAYVLERFTMEEKPLIDEVAKRLAQKVYAHLYP